MRNGGISVGSFQWDHFRWILPPHNLSSQIVIGESSLPKHRDHTNCHSLEYGPKTRKIG